MEIFEYEITTYDQEAFTNVTYLCTEQGKCSYDKIVSEKQILSNVFNSRGLEGWELIQLFFGKEGVMAFWKRKSNSV